MGPLYGTFFIEMSKVCAGKEEVDRDVFYYMIKAALAGVQNLGNAKQGDKTLLDTLIPAVDAYGNAISQGSDF